MQQQGASSPSAVSAESQLGPGLFIVIASILVLFIGLLYHFMGDSTAQVSHENRSLWAWLRYVWTSEIFDTRHGPAVPVLCAFLIYWNRKKIAAQPLGLSWAGLGGVGLALFMHWVGMRSAQPRISVVSLIFLCWSLCWLFLGWRRARYLLFPFAILLFMIPFNFLEQTVSFPLRMTVTNFSVALVHHLGIPVIRIGSQIFDPSGKFQYDVAAPCSGIRSLMTLLCIGALFGYLTQEKNWKRWFLFLSAIPLAFVGNTVRVTLIIVTAHWFGQKGGLKVHDNAGLIIFAVVLLCLFGLGTLLDLNWPETIARLRSRFRKEPAS